VRVRLVDDPRAEVGEDVRVGVGVVKCQLNGGRLRLSVAEVAV